MTASGAVALVALTAGRHSVSAKRHPHPSPPPRWGAGEGVSAFQAAFKIAWKGSLKASGVNFGKAEAHEGSLKAVLNGFQKAACVAQQSCEAKNVS